MTVTLESTAVRDLVKVLGAGLSTLDITETERNQVIARYNAVGAVLDDHWSESTALNRIYVQGSFALGTVTRKIHRNDDVDIDLVVVRGILSSSTTQDKLKADTGIGLKKFAKNSVPRPELEESERCWTLEYPGMHLDVLPAIPDGTSERGTDEGILITDRDAKLWLQSDPLGYAKWFHDVAIEEMRAEEFLLEKRGVDVADVPTWRRKTTLQLAVQALKRHRDIYFTGRLDKRPSSIIITTLAARAYRPGGNLFDVLRSIAGSLGDQIEVIDGQYIVANPVMPEENFADYWASDGGQAKNLFEWMDVLARDIHAIGARAGNDQVLKGMRVVLGENATLAGARALSRPQVEARNTGQLRAQNGTGTLSLGAVTATRPVRDHNFHGGQACL